MACGLRLARNPCARSWKSLDWLWSITEAAALRRSFPARSTTMTTTIRNLSSTRTFHGKTTIRTAEHRRNTVFAVSTRATCEVWTSTSTSQDAPLTTRLLRSEEHTSELQSLRHLVCRLLLEKKT